MNDASNLKPLSGMDEMITKPAHLPQLRDLLMRYGATAPIAPPPLPVAHSDANADIVDRATVEQFHAELSAQKYAALLGSFFDSQAGMLQRLREAISSGDRSAVWNQVHAMKGAALSLGLRAVVEQAEALKQVAASPARPSMGLALDSLERHLMITHDLCQSLGWLPAPASPTVR